MKPPCIELGNPVLSGIYALSFSGVQLYIGSSIDISRRYRQHIRLLKKCAHYNLHLQNCYHKHGEPTLVIIEKMVGVTEEGVQSVERVNDKRREGLKNFFAKNPAAISRANSGAKRSKEWKAWKSADMKSRAGSFHSEEHKQRLKGKWEGGNNPSAQSIEHNGVTYLTKKELMNALGLTNYYQLDKFLNA